MLDFPDCLESSIMILPTQGKKHYPVVLILKGINYLVILCSSKLVFRLKIFLSVAEDKLNFVTLVAQPQHGSPQMTLGQHCSEALQKMR